MRIVVSLFSWVMCCLITGCSGSREQIKIISISASENTGQDYSSWLNDNLHALVPNCWSESNFKYVDVTLKFASKCLISDISLYDDEGKFEDNPASIYALDGDAKILIGKFTGEKYKVFVEIKLPQPLAADAIIIHKYSNNIPQKIKIYGFRGKETSSKISDYPSSSVISFINFSNKIERDTPFAVEALSTNARESIAFSSSDTSILRIQQDKFRWMATIKREGKVTVTARQQGNHNYLKSEVSKNLLIRSRKLFRMVNSKIPIDPKRWFQLTNASEGLALLFDGTTNKELNTGYNKVVENYDSYYPVSNGEQIDLTGVRFYDGQGSAGGKAMKLSVISEEGQRIVIGTFSGDKYNTWVGPDPNNASSFSLPTTFRNIKCIVINSWNFFPAEIEFYGNFIAGPPITPLTKKSYLLSQMFGVNGFEWDYQAPDAPGKIDQKRMQANKSFSALRHYLDWEKIEPQEGQYTFNPVFDGSWNYDALYDSCKSAGIDVVACLKTVPPWMLQTYPANQRDRENIPAKYGKDLSDPKSYIEQARAAFQFSARYGKNKNLSSSLVKVNSIPRWADDEINKVKIGLNFIQYIECENERDKWWKGRKAYQTAFEYAANLSAFYDGHKNSMGPGVGVKNADSSMLVVMAGTATAGTDYLKGMVEWCRENRGYNQDGTVNLCWDIINYHYYSNDLKTSQDGKPTRGAAPELSGVSEIAEEFITISHTLANDLPVWVTETGYDLNQGSPFKAPAIGLKSPEETQADWILRTSLLYARNGIQRVFFYELHDDDAKNPLQFSSSGLLNQDMTLRAAAAFISQVRQKFGDYRYSETLETFPVVEHYLSGRDGLYVVYLPSENGNSQLYELNIKSDCDRAIVYTPSYKKTFLDSVMIKPKNGLLTIKISETPVFVKTVPEKNNIPGNNVSTIPRQRKRYNR